MVNLTPRSRHILVTLISSHNEMDGPYIVEGPLASRYVTELVKLKFVETIPIGRIDRERANLKLTKKGKEYIKRY